ncbi:MAG TPA: HAMP domain-containing histidine kinase [Gammaproteobacteria bacterium]|nr:HAMP domain-containing histidine kinase [Gammaproteobacteria bacterium]
MSHPATSKQQLQDAFERFNQLSEQLSGSYQSLQQQVLTLTRELAESRHQRLQLVEQMQDLQRDASRTQRLSSLGETTARLVHQIRTPLATALLYASQLEQESLDPRQRRCFVERLLVGLRHMDHMVNDLLLFARGGRGGDQEIALSELLERLKQAHWPHLQAQRAVWQVQGQGVDVRIAGHDESLLSALGNLVDNALQACGEGASLQWTIGREGDQAVLVLEDDGPGIPDTGAQRIFEPFYTTRSNGTGLGLSVVQAVIAAHEGHIHVERGSAGGARFVVRLPALEAQRLPSSLSRESQVDATVHSRCG